MSERDSAPVQVFNRNKSFGFLHGYNFEGRRLIVLRRDAERMGDVELAQILLGEESRRITSKNRQR